MKSTFQHPPSVDAEDMASNAESVPNDSSSLRSELAEQKEMNLRGAADFENFKRRNRQESETRAAAQKESFIQELLPVLDNLERALASGASPNSQELYQGVEMTLQQLRQLLRLHGIEADDCVGQSFDPCRHEAVSLRDDPLQPDHVILEVFQRGYRQGERIFRPARVVVNDLTPYRGAQHGR